MAEPAPVEAQPTKPAGARPAKASLKRNPEPAPLAPQTEEQKTAFEALQARASDAVARSEKRAFADNDAAPKEKAKTAPGSRLGLIAVPPPEPEPDAALSKGADTRFAVPPAATPKARARSETAARAEAPSPSDKAFLLSEAAAIRKDQKDENAESDEEDLFALASRELEQGRYTAAIDAFRAFLGSRPGDQQSSAAHFGLGRALFLSGRCAEAVPVFEETHDLYRSHSRAAEMMFDWASCLIRLGRTAEAIRVYESIEREHPTRRPEAQREILRLKR